MMTKTMSARNLQSGFLLRFATLRLVQDHLVILDAAASSSKYMKKKCQIQESSRNFNTVHASVFKENMKSLVFSFNLPISSRNQVFL